MLLAEGYRAPAWAGAQARQRQVSPSVAGVKVHLWEPSSPGDASTGQQDSRIASRTRLPQPHSLPQPAAAAAPGGHNPLGPAAVFFAPWQ